MTGEEKYPFEYYKRAKYGVTRSIINSIITLYKRDKFYQRRL